MKVYIITRSPFPHGMASTNRIRCYAEGLMRNCLECEVISVLPTERLDKTVLNKTIRGIFNGIPYRYLANTTVRSSSFIKRRFQDFISILKLLFFVLKMKRGNKILMYDYEDEGIILPICKLRKIEIYRELCEFPYATSNDSLIHNIRRRIKLVYTFPLYSGFIVISEELKKIAIKYGSNKTRIIKVPILINSNEYSDENYVGKRPYIFHSGTMYERKDAIVSTFKAFAIASKQLNFQVDFILAGPKSPHQKELDRIIEENSLQENVHFLGVLKKEKVVYYQNGASLAILNKNDNLQNRCGFSTKLGELLLSGTPIITTTVGEANFWLKNGESAFITEPHNPRLIADQIVKAFTDEPLRKMIGENGRKIALESFDCIKQGKLLADFLKQ